MGSIVLVCDSAGFYFLFGVFGGVMGEGTSVIECHKGRKDLLFLHFLLESILVGVEIA
jgi:hypothetical protein